MPACPSACLARPSVPVSLLRGLLDITKGSSGEAQGQLRGGLGNGKNENDVKSEDDLKSEDELKYEDNLKNEEDIKNEDDLKNKGDLKNEDNLKMRTYIVPSIRPLSY